MDIKHIPRSLQITDILMKRASLQDVRKIIVLMKLDSFWTKIVGHYLSATLTFLGWPWLLHLPFLFFIAFTMRLISIVCLLLCLTGHFFIKVMYWNSQTFSSSRQKKDILSEWFWRSRALSLLVWMKCEFAQLRKWLLRLWCVFVDHRVFDCCKTQPREETSLVRRHLYIFVLIINWWCGSI